MSKGNDLQSKYEGKKAKQTSTRTSKDAPKVKVPSKGRKGVNAS
jgi:hypothetical protein